MVHAVLQSVAIPSLIDGWLDATASEGMRLLADSEVHQDAGVFAL